MNTNKRLRSWPAETSEEEELIPGLPDDVAHLCLSCLPPSLLFSVCSSWRRLLYSPLFPPFLSLYALLTTTTTSDIDFMSYDPIAGHWNPVPPPPMRLLLRHPSFLSRTLSVQSLSVSDRLLLLAATSDDVVFGLLPALPLPLVFSPLTSSWSHGPHLPAPRRWCAAGTLSGEVFVASGIGSHFSDEIARSFHHWRPGAGDGWHPLRRMKDGKFSREAIDAVGCRGKLYMVNVKGSAAKQGTVYDADKGEWEEMPEKMVGGWRGPAAAMAEEEIYMVDEDKGALSRWDFFAGDWVGIVELPELRGAQQISAAGGKVCAVVKGAGGIVVVDVKTTPARLWVVETPPGSEAIAVHVLPRMCCPLE